MIELRWVKRIVPVTIPAGTHYRESRVLQYREWPHGTMPGNIEPQWQDVPEVEE